MAEISFSENYYGSGGTYTITENIEIEAGDLISEMPSDMMREELDSRGELYPDTDEIVKMLVDADAEREMLDQIDISTAIEIYGEADLLSEMDDAEILKYSTDNGIVDIANLDDFGTEALVDELLQRNDYDAILSQLDSEFIQAHLVNKRGGFTLETVPTEEMISCLENERDVKVGGFTLTSEVIHAARVLDEFTSYIFNSRDGYEGKRFAFPTE